MLDVCGRPVLNDIGDPWMMRNQKFRFQWSPYHFEYNTDQFITKFGELDEDGRADFKVLSEFVQSFSSVQKVDHVGRLVVEDDG